MTQQKQQEVYDILIKMIAENRDTITWAEIKEAIDVQMKVENWMRVRDVVQYIIECNLIRRTRNLKEEVYAIIA